MPAAAKVRYDVALLQRLSPPRWERVWLLLALSAMLGCPRPQAGTAERADGSPAVRDAGEISSADLCAAAERDAGARKVRPTETSAAAMPFALVAVEEVSQLHKLLDGNVLAASGGALHALDRDGGVQSLDSVFAAMKDALGDLGSVGGTWPGTLFVETYRLGAGDGLTTSFVLQGDSRRAAVQRRVTGSYWLPPQPWKGQALLLLRADGHSETFGSPLDRGARLETLRPIQEPLPRLPKEALVDNAVAAYPDGSIFVLGGRRTRPVDEADASEYEQEHHYMVDGAIVWQKRGPAPSLLPVQLPGTSPRDRLRNGRLSRGRSEYETLAYGVLERWRDRKSTDEPYLARFGPSGWQRIPLAAPLLRVDTGSDGSTWAVYGSDGYANTDESFLARLTLPANGGVTLAPVPLAPLPAWNTLDKQTALLLGDCRKLRPRELAVVSQADLWLTAHCLHGHDYPPTVLLHTQTQKPVVEFKTFERTPPKAR